MLVARRDRGVAVARRQDAHGRTVAVGNPLARPALARQPSARQLGNRERGESFLDRDVDHGRRARAAGEQRMHAGASGGDPADKGGLFPHRADRRLVEIIDLARQHAGDPAGEKQGEVGCRILGLGPGLPKGRDRRDCRGRVQPAQRFETVFPALKFARAAFAHDQVSACDRRAGGGRVGATERLAVVEILRERRRARPGLDTNHPGADIRENPAANGGREPLADLHDLNTRQDGHLT